MFVKKVTLNIMEFVQDVLMTANSTVILTNVIAMINYSMMNMLTLAIYAQEMLILNQNTTDVNATMLSKCGKENVSQIVVNMKDLLLVEVVIAFKVIQNMMVKNVKNVQ